MKKTLFIILALTLLFSTTSFAAITEWRVSWTPAEKQKLHDNISQHMNQQWIPVGLSGRNNQIFILYVKNPNNTLGIRRWSLNWYKNINALRAGLTTRLNNGYLPMGMTYYRNMVWVFYVQGRIRSSGWKIVNAEPNAVELRSKINGLIEMGYFPVDITIVDGQFVILAINDPSARNMTWIIKKHSNKTNLFRSQVTTMVNQRWVPYTFTYHLNNIFIFYFKHRGQ